MRLMFLGDVVGRAGRKAVVERLPGLVDALGLDFVVVNAENAAGGFGITEEIAQDLVDAGADALTLGNHSWDQREALVFIERQPRLLRPANYPAGTPGRGANLYVARNGARVLVVQVMGRIYMDPLDDPFAAAEREIAACPLAEQADAIVLDVHAEATSEKQAMAHHFDGRVSLVIGTHTHVPTADARVLPKGTAYQGDAGMTGAYEGIIGFDPKNILERFRFQTPRGMETATRDVRLCGAVVDVDEETGKARSIVSIQERLGG